MLIGEENVLFVNGNDDHGSTSEVAALKAGAKHFFVEQDQTPGNPLDSLRGSATYLKGLKF